MESKSKEVETKYFKVIQCRDHIYITDDRTGNRGYYSSDIENLLFDGNKVEKTYKNNWYKLSKIPKSVKKKLPDQKINIRYELKEGYPSSDLLPKVIYEDRLIDTEYEEVSGLYQYRYDTIDGEYEEIPFTIEVIYKKDDFEWIKKQYASHPDLITQIEYHPDLYQEVPCSITSEEMFDIIRKHVKTNINPSVAKVTSDYGFHFEVKREIAIAEPYSFIVNKNAGDKRRRPNWVTNWVRSKSITILNLRRSTMDSTYGNDCKLAPSFFGKNQTDLENKINQYLDELMAEINKQYIECPHCKGWGVIEGVSNG
jgi:hypothetical protein